MSLVGSLEDLGLGDILQIISLSRKSGLLLLRSEEGDGRIVFCDGLVRAAFVKGEVEDLRGLLVNGGFIDEAAFDQAAEIATAHDDSVDDVLARRNPELSKERLDSLRREQAERCAFRMFTWTTGEFSFEIRDEIDDRDNELLLATGVNAQYLTMEATRLSDEGGDDLDDDIQFGTIDDAVGVTDASESLPETPVADMAIGGSAAAASAADIDNENIVETLAMAAVERTDASGNRSDAADEFAISARVDGFDVADDLPDPDGAPAPAEPEPAAASDETSAAEVSAAVAADPVAATASDPTALILIDPDLAALEWQKSVLGPICRRIHIFQRSDGGIARLRQYLRRGEAPVVLVAEKLPADPHNGILDSLELTRRLRAHAPRLPIYLISAGDDPAPLDLGAANGSLRRPANHQLSNRRAWGRLEGDGQALRNALSNRTGGPQPERASPRSPDAASHTRTVADDGEAVTELRRLRRISERLRDPSVRGEVLSLILEFAAESFSRVAIFMVRDDDVVGMAQSGLSRAGGPDDEAFREILLSATEPNWFRAVLERGEGIAAAPLDDGDRRLAGLLGSRLPERAYVAPIESSHRVVALVYVDNLPGNEPLGDTTLLEIVLHEAGLALERALLERALADLGENGSG
jgi:hypothetical protein